MNTSKLLAPRVKVIGDYPFAMLNVGDVVTFKSFNGVWLSESYPIEGRALQSPDWFDQFPAIFRKMTWAEDRKPQELPLYAKSVKSGNILPIHRWVTWTHFKSSSAPNALLLPADEKWYLPATASDYEAYIKQQK